jgi:hypothetical protein
VGFLSGSLADVVERSSDVDRLTVTRCVGTGVCVLCALALPCVCACVCGLRHQPSVCGPPSPPPPPCAHPSLPCAESNLFDCVANADVTLECGNEDVRAVYCSSALSSGRSYDVVEDSPSNSLERDRNVAITVVVVVLGSALVVLVVACIVSSARRRHRRLSGRGSVDTDGLIGKAPHGSQVLPTGPEPSSKAPGAGAAAAASASASASAPPATHGGSHHHDGPHHPHPHLHDGPHHAHTHPLAQGAGADAGTAVQGKDPVAAAVAAAAAPAPHVHVQQAADAVVEVRAPAAAPPAGGSTPVGV